MPQVNTCDFSHTADVEGFSLACGKLEPWAEIRVWKIAGIDLCDASRHHMCDPLDKATLCGAVGELVCMSTTAVFTKLFKVSLALWQAVARWRTMITVLLWMLPSISLKNYLKRWEGSAACLATFHSFSGQLINLVTFYATDRMFSKKRGRWDATGCFSFVPWIYFWWFT